MSVVRATLGSAMTSFECCDTRFSIHAEGFRAASAVQSARETAERLERQLDAFEETSAVARLNEHGRVENEHVARVVERGLEYHERTAGRFDIRHGEVEHDVKAYIHGDGPEPSVDFTAASVAVDGEEVTADRPVDLNGLAKGYLVDRAAERVSGLGRRGFVDGGGDISPPTGPVEIENPHGGTTPLRVVETDWHIATSGDYRRVRDGVDHIYDPTRETLGATNDLVTVLARRDCTEADALATVLATMGPEEAISFAEEWDGLEAFVLHSGVFYETLGFDDHVMGGR